MSGGRMAVGSLWATGRPAPDFLAQRASPQSGPHHSPQEPKRKTLRGAAGSWPGTQCPLTFATASVFCESPALWRPSPWTGSQLSQLSRACVKESGSAQCSTWASSLNPHRPHGRGILPLSSPPNCRGEPVSSAIKGANDTSPASLKGLLKRPNRSTDMLP